MLDQLQIKNNLWLFLFKSIDGAIFMNEIFFWITRYLQHLSPLIKILNALEVLDIEL